METLELEALLGASCHRLVLGEERKMAMLTYFGPVVVFVVVISLAYDFFSEYISC